jgi:hypothetical protein
VIPISFLGLGEENLSAPFAKLPLSRHSDLAVAQVVINVVNLIGYTKPAEFFSAPALPRDPSGLVARHDGRVGRGQGGRTRAPPFHPAK